MARRLDKIEKEMGYCEIKLEKERRLYKQIAFLRAEIAALNHLLCQYQSAGVNPRALTTRSPDGDGARRPSREEFLAAGLIEIVREERDILSRETEDLEGRLHTFSGFETKRSVLEEEERNALRDLAPAHSSKMRRINEEFKRIERQWN